MPIVNSTSRAKHHALAAPSEASEVVVSSSSSNTKMDNYDYESQQPFAREDFLDEKYDIEVRHGFLRKVFSIVGIQLAVTALIAAPFCMEDNRAAMQWVVANQGLVIFCGFLPLIMILLLICNPQWLRKYPHNYIFLTILTLCMGLSVGVQCLRFTTSSIMMVFGMTAVIVVGLAAFAIQTKIDFSGMAPYLFAFMLGLMVFGLVMMFFPSALMERIYCTCGAILFSFYIIYDVQMIVGGQHHQAKVSVDDYAFAALTLYLDIVNLFLFLLRLFAEDRR